MLEALLPPERVRITQVDTPVPTVDVLDVSQNPDVRARLIKVGEPTFMTVIAGSGYLVRLDTMRSDPRLTRMVTAADVLALSGFPVTADQVSAAGCECMFSHSRRAPTERTPHSMKKQCGNAMHFAHVGSVLLCALIRFPHVGTRDTTSHTEAHTRGTTRRRTITADHSESEPAAEPSRSSVQVTDLLRAVRARRNR